MSTHTPGPWDAWIQERVGDCQGLERWAVGSPDRDDRYAAFVICDLRDWDNKTARANAYLIAAAPTMLAALEAVQTALVRLQLKCDEYDQLLGVDGIPAPLQEAAEEASPALVLGAAAIAKAKGEKAKGEED
jgi:hypothetical protein